MGFETMQIDPFRNALGGKTEANKDLRQIALLNQILVTKSIAEGSEFYQAKEDWVSAQAVKQVY